MVYVCSTNESGASSQLSSTPLVFFHGFGGGASSYEWSKVYPAFTATHQVIAPDLVGWGQSQHPPRNYTSADYLLVLREFVQGIANAPIAAVASTLTAALLVRLAVRYPELFDSLFLVCPSGFRDFGQASGRRIPLPIINTPLLDRAIYSLGATSEFAVRNFLERFIFANCDRISPETVSAYLNSARRPNAEYAALAFLRGDLYFDLAEYAPYLTVPTAIVWGERAQFISAELGRQLAELNSTSITRVQIVPQAGVFPHLELPATVIALLTDWLLSRPQKAPLTEAS
ncbi:MAG: alpha/beta hydrolase [Cyanobacteria bacterium P01_F01_bin.33]